VTRGPDQQPTVSGWTTVEAARFLLADWLAQYGAPRWLSRLAAGLPLRRKWHEGWDARRWRQQQMLRRYLSEKDAEGRD
jgi:hypothetical protein